MSDWQQGRKLPRLPAGLNRLLDKVVTEIIAFTSFALLLKSKKAKRMISNLFALSVRFLSFFCSDLQRI